MQIQIKNIWKIKEATINLDWLSVIAWNNDTWKSTISKVVFSIIKALQKYKEFSSKEKEIKKYVERLYFASRSVFHYLRQEKKEESWSIFKELKYVFEPDIFWENFIKNDDKILFLEEKKNFIKDLKFDNFLKNDFYELILKIKEEYLKEETKEYLTTNALNEIFNREFNWELNCIKNKWEILVNDWELLLFKIEIKSNKAKIKITDDFLKIKDSTFINSPIILDFFNNSRHLNIQYHYDDLFNKINNIDTNNKKRKNWFWKVIKDTIKWSFEIRDDFIWKKLTFTKDGVDWDIEIINTATWIKSFWILDLLDKSNCLDWDDLLILDEPEVHLHPEWQVVYAKLIIYLIKERWLSVLITSHSPYMIEALSKFSKNKDKVKASFYLSEEKNWKVEINDKTNKKYEIFEKLSKPFRDLMLK